MIEEEGSADPDIVKLLGVGRRRSRRWPWVLAVGAIVLISAVCCGVLASRGGQWSYETQAVARGDLTLTVVAVGKLEPLNTVEIGSELSGIVRQVHVDANDPVTAGQVLAELDATLLDAQTRQARAQVTASEASLAQARVQATAAGRDLRRAESLAASGSIAAASLDDARSASEQAAAAVDVARAQVLQARASLASAEANLEKVTILSPIDGVVLERNVETGQSVVSALQAATLFRLAQDLTRMKVSVEVDEAYIGRMRAGQAATFTVAAYPERVFDAVVAKVHLSPIAGQQVVTYEAELHLDNPDALLLPGMTATAVVVTDTVQAALLIPNAALRFTPANQQLPPPAPREGKRVARVWLSTGGEPVPAEIVSGATDGLHSVVLEGELKEGDVVITAASRGAR